MQRPIHLILDFDGTLTHTDTLSALAAAGYTRQRALHRPDPTPWPRIVDAYMADLAAHVTRQPPSAERTTLAAEYATLDSLRAVEDASVRRITDAGVFAQVRRAELEAAAREALRAGEVRLRKGWEGLVRRVGFLNRGCFPGWRGGVDVVSVNFSRWWVWSVLKAGAGGVHGAEGRPEQAALGIGVWANEVGEVEKGGEGGENVRGEVVEGELRTSGDKARVFREIVREARGEDALAPLTVYLGDSNTDLETLVAADIGICIRDDPMASGQRELAATCERLGVGVSHISEHGNPFKITEAGELEEERLWFAKEYAEVETWLRMFIVMTEEEKTRAQDRD